MVRLANLRPRARGRQACPEPTLIRVCTPTYLHLGSHDPHHRRPRPTGSLNLEPLDCPQRGHDRASPGQAGRSHRRDGRDNRSVPGCHRYGVQPDPLPAGSSEGTWRTRPRLAGRSSRPTPPASPSSPCPHRHGRHVLHQCRPAGPGRGLRRGCPARLWQRQPRDRRAIRHDRTPHPRRAGTGRAAPDRPRQDPADRQRSRVRASRDHRHCRMTPGTHARTGDWMRRHWTASCPVASRSWDPGEIWRLVSRTTLEQRPAQRCAGCRSWTMGRGAGRVVNRGACCRRRR